LSLFCVLYSLLLMSLDCPFWIIPSVFSNFYSPLKVLRWTICKVFVANRREKNLHNTCKRQKIHCHLWYWYFETINQFDDRNFFVAMTSIKEHHSLDVLIDFEIAAELCPGNHCIGRKLYSNIYKLCNICKKFTIVELVNRSEIPISQMTMDLLPFTCVM
jgi:hypothetical protein